MAVVELLVAMGKEYASVTNETLNIKYKVKYS
jgi:hypothetical protein